jgi:hypothetical protein
VPYPGEPREDGIEMAAIAAGPDNGEAVALPDHTAAAEAVVWLSGQEADARQAPAPHIEDGRLVLADGRSFDVSAFTTFNHKLLLELALHEGVLMSRVEIFELMKHDNLKVTTIMINRFKKSLGNSDEMLRGYIKVYKRTDPGDRKDYLCAGTPHDPETKEVPLINEMQAWAGSQRKTGGTKVPALFGAPKPPSSTKSDPKKAVHSAPEQTAQKHTTPKRAAPSPKKAASKKPARPVEPAAPEAPAALHYTPFLALYGPKNSGLRAERSPEAPPALRYQIGIQNVTYNKLPPLTPDGTFILGVLCENPGNHSLDEWVSILQVQGLELTKDALVTELMTLKTITDGLGMDKLLYMPKGMLAFRSKDYTVQLDS